MKETWDRLWAKTPRYWARLRNWAAGASAALTTALTYSESMPETLVSLLEHGLTATVVVTLVAQLTRSEPS